MHGYTLYEPWTPDDTIPETVLAIHDREFAFKRTHPGYNMATVEIRNPRKVEQARKDHPNKVAHDEKLEALRSAEAHEWGLDIVLDYVLSAPAPGAPSLQNTTAGATAPTALLDTVERPSPTPYRRDQTLRPQQPSMNASEKPEIVPQGRWTNFRPPTADQLQKIAQQVQQSKAWEESGASQSAAPVSPSAFRKAPIPAEVVELVAKIKALPKHRHETRLPVRIHLGAPDMRKDFRSKGTLRETSILYQYRGDTSLFTPAEWTYLCEDKVGTRTEELQRLESGLSCPPKDEQGTTSDTTR